ncbi:uncharacterized protein (DUF305 family) [Amycolatopsis lexingtonensis]|uniref:Uncharacterized protein (DUF305 family) n=1 Tax=Amycolatopsis lexingtonensis TaxID=218822 RepID=A0ABR9HUQ6_9PSEU|nr:uncharacterized protein (DUF305 family) [Amycolatopsis lexingtonensis]
MVALILGGCATTAPAAPGPATTPAAFNPTDVAWLQLVVPMTANALAAARLAPQRAGSAAVRSAASAVVAPSERLLTRLKSAQHRAGLPDSDVHSGHRMPGMVTPADLAALRTDGADEFDRRLIALLQAHAAQVVVLARGEQTSGADPETRALAAELGAEGARETEVLAK